MNSLCGHWLKYINTVIYVQRFSHRVKMNVGLAVVGLVSMGLSLEAKAVQPGFYIDLTLGNATIVGENEGNLIEFPESNNGIDIRFDSGSRPVNFGANLGYNIFLFRDPRFLFGFEWGLQDFGTLTQEVISFQDDDRVSSNPSVLAMNFLVTGYYRHLPISFYRQTRWQREQHSLVPYGFAKLGLQWQRISGFGDPSPGPNPGEFFGVNEDGVRSVAPMLAVGVGLELYRHVDVYVQYSYTFGSDIEEAFVDGGGNDALAIHLVTLGLKFSF